MEVTITFSPQAKEVLVCTMEVESGITVGAALQQSGVLSGINSSELDLLQVSVWGRKSPLDYVLREYDRVELCRPLRVDPKLARRERFTRQGAKSAGLFSSRRPGAKAGY